MYLQEPELFGCGNYVPVLYHKEKRWSPIRTNFGKMLVDKISPKGWEALIWSSDTTGQNIKGPVVVTWIFVRGRGQFFLAVVLQHSIFRQRMYQCHRNSLSELI